MLQNQWANPLRYLYRDGRSSEGQAEEHQKGNDFMVGVDVGQTQAAVMAVEARLYWFKYVRPLQEVEADHRRHQDWQLTMDIKMQRSRTAKAGDLWTVRQWLHKQNLVDAANVPITLSFSDQDN